MAYLEELYANRNLPDEPYYGVAGLFDADLHSVIPNWAPREDWEVISPYEIRLVGRAVVASTQP